MPTVTVRTATLVLVSTAANSNKFYRLELDDTGRVAKTYGRVGSDGVTNYENTGLTGFNKMLESKKRKGYKEIDVADAVASTTSRVDNTRLTSIAKAGLTGTKRKSTVLEALIERIVAVNAHDIALSSGGLIKVDTSGQIKTAVGLVTKRSVTEAERILAQLETAQGTAFTRLLEDYLTYVPQKVGGKAGWQDTFLATPAQYTRQRTFLQQLRDSLDYYETAAASAAETDDTADADALFKYRLKPVAESNAVFSRIVKKYESTKNDNHTSSSLKVKRVFELIDPAGEATYKAIVADIGNEQELWHGTRAVNLLSILRSGLYVPPTRGSSIQIAGRMFGDGVYLSAHSTKSLNYSAGYWTAGGRDNNCFMLLADVAMGSEFRPNDHGYSGWNHRIATDARTGKNKFGKPWNSINVKPGTCGVRNHEAIVWNTEQIRLRYLVEFE